MTLKKAFIYTIAGSVFLLLFSYLASAQTKKPPLKDAPQLTLTNNRELKVSDPGIVGSPQQVPFAKSVALLNAGISGQVAHYFNDRCLFWFREYRSIKA